MSLSAPVRLDRAATLLLFLAFPRICVSPSSHDYRSLLLEHYRRNTPNSQKFGYNIFTIEVCSGQRIRESAGINVAT